MHCLASAVTADQSLVNARHLCFILNNRYSQLNSQYLDVLAVPASMSCSLYSSVQFHDLQIVMVKDQLSQSLLPAKCQSQNPKPKSQSLHNRFTMLQ